MRSRRLLLGVALGGAAWTLTAVAHLGFLGLAGREGLFEAARGPALWALVAVNGLGLLLGVVTFAATAAWAKRLRILRGRIAICASCKSIRDAEGVWNRLEEFVEANSHAEFTHGLCASCVSELRDRTTR